MMGDEHQRCAQWEGKKSKIPVRDECTGRDYRPNPNPGLAGGGTNTKIARQQDAMWTKGGRMKKSGQFQGK